ncbi:MAG: diguanylate cyclase [Aquisalimonadaceae bacterium]
MDTHKFRRPRLHPLTLAFRTAERENTYLRDCAQRLRDQQRIALALGALLWMGLCIHDPWFFPDDYRNIWMGRLFMGSALLLGLVSTFQPWWPAWHTRILVVLISISVIASGLVIIRGGPDVVPYYHQGILLTLIWSTIFAGLRFVVTALLSVFTLLYSIGLLFGMGGVPAGEIITTLLIIFATAVMGCFGTYLLEFQRRQMFHYNALLDRDRRSKRLKALRDPLTGLPNRLQFEQRAEEALARARRHHKGVGLIFVDLNQFKPVNDTWGHRAGDEVLREVANRLSVNVRFSDVVARLGGDEFIVLVEDLDNPEMLATLAEKLEHCVKVPVALPQDTHDPALRTIRVTASIGSSFFPRDGATLETLIHRADEAMYNDKGSRRRPLTANPDSD